MRLLKNQQPKKLVLLVDDSSIMCKLLAGILERHYEVQACISAVDAIDWLSKSKKSPDVVVSDIAMSEMDGIEFGQYLSINGLHGQVPLIFMSGKSEDELRPELNTVKYNGFTKKPFNPDTLLNAIAAVA